LGFKHHLDSFFIVVPSFSEKNVVKNMLTTFVSAPQEFVFAIVILFSHLEEQLFSHKERGPTDNRPSSY